MNVILTVNEEYRAMLMHDKPLGFIPSWVEFSRDKRGVRIIGNDGREFQGGVIFDAETSSHLDRVADVLLVQMKDQKPQEGYFIPFVNQHYEGLAT